MPALVLDEFNNVRLRENFFAGFFKVGQCLRVHVFYFDGDQVTILSKIHHRFVVSKFAACEGGKLMARCLGVGVEHGEVEVKIYARLNEHAAKLASTDYPNFKILIKCLRHNHAK